MCVPTRVSALVYTPGGGWGDYNITATVKSGRNITFEMTAKQDIGGGMPVHMSLRMSLCTCLDAAFFPDDGLFPVLAAHLRKKGSGLDA